ncbi:MAG: Cell division protein FtsI [Peptidoglycan synthetase] (EC [uncultured Sulfurovum sp.]|uniref:Cell division protein FtsI [Peptidoglycan synthetase] (EC) n=1 Tax=uncultured Sulfurovum sp. TaxID=269237 RepID=A0A6S6S3U0_9BACT|nr:MAG: Cell division protein FtsI [Peptidoglycan synthetase] (EC [uncultured Sulfurovum sp.]
MRFPIIFIIFILFWIMLISRIYQISVKSNYYYENLAQMNIERKYFIKPVRGEILDRNRKLLAVNDIGFSIKIAPHLTRYDKEKKRRVPKEELDKLISGIVNEFPDLNKTKLIKKYIKKDSSYNHRYIPVVDFIGYDGMIGAYPKLSINKSLKIESETKRLYPAGSMATHIVGYVGRSNLQENEKDPVVEKVGVIGKTGLERQYNQVLQGELGYRLVQVSARNKEVAELEKVEPKDDQNLVLNIDLELQKRINALFVGQAGIAVVMGIDGDIIAGVSYPSYDPNLFVGGISSKEWKALITDLDHPFTNKIIGGAYPPGSAIKMGMALAFSKAGKPVENTEYCKGYITLGKSKHKFRCWSRYGHGTVGLRKAIRESCDVYFYNKALQTGINSMAKSLREMGLGVKTGVDLPRERSGIVPDKAWKRKRFNQGWYRGETVISSIGQGYNLATPLQVARYTAFLATERLPTPRFVDVIAGTKVQKEYKTLEVNKQHLNTIRLGMYDVCNSPRGTAKRTMSNLPIVVAGKTGTSQVVSIPQSEKVRMKESEMDYYSRSHAWLTTYAPYENPKYVVTVLVEHGGHGGSTAGPIAAEIYKWMANEGYFGDEFKGKIKLKDLSKKKKGKHSGH